MEVIIAYAFDYFSTKPKDYVSSSIAFLISNIKIN